MTEYTCLISNIDKDNSTVVTNIFNKTTSFNLFANTFLS